MASIGVYGVYTADKQQNVSELSHILQDLKFALYYGQILCLDLSDIMSSRYFTRTIIFFLSLHL